MNIKDALNLNNLNNSELQELANVINFKAAQTTGTSIGVREVDYDAELERLTWKTSPAYAYLKTKIESPANSAEVGFRTKTQKTTASFIAEEADIPAHDPSIYEKTSQPMSTLVYPVEISDLAQKGTNIVDLMEDELRDGMIDINRTKDYNILQGNTDTEPNAFDGFTTLFTTNVTDLKKAQITLEDLGVLAQSILDVGGSPSAIITTAAVARRLGDLILAKMRYNYAPMNILGFNVLSYVTPAGAQIPIIIDPNLEPSADGHQLIMIDEESLRIKELVPPTVIDLAKTKLSTSKVIYNFMTMYCRSEHKNGYLYNINPKVE